MVPQLNALIASLHAAGIRSVGLVWQPLPGSQDGFGEDYGVMSNAGPPAFTQTGVSTSCADHPFCCLDVASLLSSCCPV